MLFYHGSGERRYDESPHRETRRVHWEIAAILAGRAWATSGPEVRGPHLWIFPPDHLHGWRSDQACTIFTVHVAHLPRIIADPIRESEALMMSLDQQQVERLVAVDTKLHDLFALRPDAGEIAADIVRAEIGQLVLPALPQRGARAHVGAERLVKEMLAWLQDHLHLGVGVAEAAEAVGVSPAHARRLAHAATGRSPRDLLDELRIERAQALMRETRANLDSIAYDCGFGSAVALSQAFVRRIGMRPGKWRSQVRKAS